MGGDLRYPRRAALPNTAAVDSMALPAVISTHVPVALRTFLLTLAVVDDLFAITVIAGLESAAQWLSTVANTST